MEMMGVGVKMGFLHLFTIEHSTECGKEGVPHVLSINQIFSIVVLNSATFN